jgi:hypothetical protein
VRTRALLRSLALLAFAGCRPSSSGAPAAAVDPNVALLEKALRADRRSVHLGFLVQVRTGLVPVASGSGGGALEAGGRSAEVHFRGPFHPTARDSTASTQAWRVAQAIWTDYAEPLAIDTVRVVYYPDSMTRPGFEAPAGSQRFDFTSVELRRHRLGQ